MKKNESSPKNLEGDDVGGSDNDLDLDDIGVDLASTTIDFDPRSLPMIVAGIVFCGLIYMLFSNVAQTITASVIGLLFALALDPVVRKVQFMSFGFVTGDKNVDNEEPKEKIGRYSAVSIVLGTFLIVLIVGGYFLAPKVIDQVQNFAKDIPETVRDLGKLPIVGEKLGKQETQDNIKKALQELPKKLSSKNSPIGDILKSFADGAFVGLLFILMFVALLLDGPRLVKNIRRLIVPKHREAADRIARVTYKVIGKYMAGSIDRKSVV